LPSRLRTMGLESLRFAFFFVSKRVLAARRLREGVRSRVLC
jgi:hypothetical protein